MTVEYMTHSTLVGQERFLEEMKCLEIRGILP